MPKRRRERDRPKAAHDAIYHPNKRVLLSYESDEEVTSNDDGHPNGTGHPRAFDAAIDNYEIPTYPDEEENGMESSVMGNPVALEDNVDEEQGANEEDSPAPRARSTKDQRSGEIRKNPTTNLRPALGSLSYQWDGEEGEGEEEYDTEEDEAMAYLKAVRSERQTIPTVLRAPCESEPLDMYANGVGDSRGYLADGAYVGRPTVPATTQDYWTPQEAFTLALKNRFLDQRKQAHLAVSTESIKSLSDHHPIFFSGNTEGKKETQWRSVLRTTTPVLAQLQAFHQDTVFGLLRLVQSMYLTTGSDIPTIASVWIWSLLSRLDEVGTMDNDQVSVVREFGKQAVLVLVSLRDPTAAQHLEAVSAGRKIDDSDLDTQGSRLDSHENDEVEIVHLKTPVDENKVPNATEQGERRKNTQATLDMIITIIGDVFGQRDLLEFRRSWETHEERQ